jgi:hypothetical protein
VKQERTDLFHFKARRISETVKTAPLTILALITQCIVFVAIHKDGNFSRISELKSIPTFEPITAFKQILPSEKKSSRNSYHNERNGVCAFWEFQQTNSPEDQQNFLRIFASLFPSLINILIF